MTNVLGARKVHKLDVIVNKNGEVRTIRCVPCGQLTWSYDSDDVTSDDALLKPEVQYTAVSWGWLNTKLRQLNKRIQRLSFNYVTSHQSNTYNAQYMYLLKNESKLSMSTKRESNCKTNGFHEPVTETEQKLKHCNASHSTHFPNSFSLTKSLIGCWNSINALILRRNRNKFAAKTVTRNLNAIFQRVTSVLMNSDLVLVAGGSRPNDYSAERSQVRKCVLEEAKPTADNDRASRDKNCDVTGERWWRHVSIKTVSDVSARDNRCEIYREIYELKFVQYRHVCTCTRCRRNESLFSTWIRP